MPDLTQRIRERLAELRDGASTNNRADDYAEGDWDDEPQEFTYEDGIITACAAIEPLLDAPEYVDQWPESAKALADAIRERDEACQMYSALEQLGAAQLEAARRGLDEAREAARWLHRQLGSYGGVAPHEEAIRSYPWLKCEAP